MDPTVNETGFPSQKVAEALIGRWLADLQRASASTSGTWMDPYLRRYLLPQAVSAGADWEKLVTPDSIAWMHPNALIDSVQVPERNPENSDRLSSDQLAVLRSWRDLVHVWRCTFDAATGGDVDAVANLDALCHQLGGAASDVTVEPNHWRTLWRQSPRVTPGRFDSFQSGIQKVVFSSVAGRECIASAHRDGVIRFWDSTTLEAVSELRAHRGGIGALVSCPGEDGGPWIVSAGVDRSIAVSRVTADGPVLTNRFLHNSEVDALAVTRLTEGPLCALVGCRNGLVLLQRLLDGRVLGTYETLGSQPRDFTSVPRADGAILSWVATRHGDVIELELTQFGEHEVRIVGRAQVHAASELWAVSSLVTQANNVEVAAGGSDGRLYLWKWSDSPELKSSDKVHDGGIFSIVSDPDRDAFISGGGDGNVRESTHGSASTTLPSGGMVGRINGLSYQRGAFGQSRVACGSSASMGRVWDARTSTLVGDYIDHKSYNIHAVCCSTTSGGGDFVATIGDGNQILVWDLDSGSSREIAGPIFVDRACGIGAYWLGDRQLLAAGSYDGSLVSWALDGSTSSFLQKDGIAVEAMCVISPRLQAPKLMSGHSDGMLRIWDLATGKEDWSARVAEGPVLSISAPPESDGSTLVAIGCDNGDVWVADSGTPSIVTFIGRHNGAVRGLRSDVIDNLLWITSAADDDHISAWNFDPATGISQLVWTKPGFRGRVLTRLNTDSGAMILGAGDASEIRAWKFETGEEAYPSLALTDRPSQMTTLETSESSFLISGAGMALMRLG